MLPEQPHLIRNRNDEILFFFGAAFSKEQGKEHKNHRRHRGGKRPYLLPLMTALYCKMLDNSARYFRADQRANAVGQECDKPLRAGADIGTGAAVDVDLAGDKEKVKADAV